ncbi:MAG: hypothetical protein IIZ75_03340 [Lachnospiraceae bacterium]|nr:hypothetical protein [Lachnospiraceae bacterium]
MDKIKYRLDMLTAYNEKLINSDRMYKMIALSTGGIYYYRNIRHNITELTGPWDKYLGYKPIPGEFTLNDLSTFIIREDFERFLTQIADMDKRGAELARLSLKGNNGQVFDCFGAVYYDADGNVTDKLTGLIKRLPNNEA